MSTSPDEYATNLTDEQWQVLSALLPDRLWHWGGPGRPPCDVRLVINGLMYRAKTGCAWRLLPTSFGSWKTVYGYFRRWRQQGHWDRILDALTRQDRTDQGRCPMPSAGIVDAQSVKTATQGKTVGYDGGKKIKGRKRHLLVDTDGRVLECVVTAASTSDADGLKALLHDYCEAGVPRLKKLWVDGGYRGEELKKWVADLKKTHKIDLEVVQKQGPGFQVLPRRWGRRTNLCVVVQLSNTRQRLRNLARQQSSVYPHRHDSSVTQANRKTKRVLRQLLSTVQVATRIIVLDNGRIVEQGKHEDLISANGIYAEFFNVQSARYAGSQVVEK